MTPATSYRKGSLRPVYADDTALYAHIPTPHAVTEVCRNLQAGVDALAAWGAQWRVTFERTKSQAMTVSRHRRPWETPPISSTEQRSRNAHSNLSSKLHGNQPLLSPQHHDLDTAIFVLVCVLVCTHILE